MIKLIDRKEKSGFFRWHDSGDITSTEHLNSLFDIAEALPHIQFWLPTKEFKMVREVLLNRSCPDNLTIRLSAFKVEASVKQYAGRLGVTASAVTKDKSKANCPSYQQGGICGDCRKCWDKNNKETIYLKH